MLRPFCLAIQGKTMVLGQCAALCRESSFSRENRNSQLRSKQVEIRTIGGTTVAP